MPFVIKNKEQSNLGWLFYKYYFEDSDKIDLKNEENNRLRDTLANRNETILKRKFEPCDHIFSLNSMHPFPLLKVCYPGLLIGSGYTHEAVFEDKDDKNDALKIGFFFDYSTGMPCLPGHSVKGALRSVFPNHKNEKHIKAKSELIVDLLKKSNVDSVKCFNEYLDNRKISGVAYSDVCFAKLLGEIIFEGQEPYGYSNGEFLYEQISLYRKDIFHDAYIENAGAGGFFLATDYITHHADPLKDPNPVKFLKILPEVKIQFQFDLKDGLISKEAKIKLFHLILLDFGIGAKTNVGYGQFEEGFTDVKTEDKSTLQKQGRRTEISSYTGKIKQNEQIEAIVIDPAKKLVKAIIHGTETILNLSGNCPAKDAIILAKINSVNKKNEILQVGFLKQI
jgi:CRISPR-associated protein Cmr6